MTTAGSILYVEGKADRRFFHCLLRHMDISGVETAFIGGGAPKLDKVSQRIQRSHDEGKKVFVVPDADSDFSARRKEYDERQRILQLPVNGCFFTPNHCDPERLENLLEAMAVPPHDVLYRCMDDYGE